MYIHQDIPVTLAAARSLIVDLTDLFTFHAFSPTLTASTDYVYLCTEITIRSCLLVSLSLNRLILCEPSWQLCILLLHFLVERGRLTLRLLSDYSRNGGYCFLQHAIIAIIF